mgnify:CR=1 FL=1
MSKIFGKRNMMLGVLVLALGAAVYLNYSFAAPAASSIAKAGTTAKGDHLGDAQYVGNTTVANAQSAAYFKQARQNRETARSEALEMVQDLMNNAKISGNVQAEVVQKVKDMADAVDQESKIENLIKAKGFADCVVYIEGEKCNVVVPGETLTSQQTAQITEIVLAQSKVKSQNITIVPVKS